MQSSLALSLSIFSFIHLHLNFSSRLLSFNSYAFALREYQRWFLSILGPSNGKPQRALTLSLAPSWVGSWPAHLRSISGPIIISLIHIITSLLKREGHGIRDATTVDAPSIRDSPTANTRYKFRRNWRFPLTFYERNLIQSYSHTFDSSCYYVCIILIIILPVNPFFSCTSQIHPFSFSYSRGLSPVPTLWLLLTYARDFRSRRSDLLNAIPSGIVSSFLRDLVPFFLIILDHTWSGLTIRGLHPFIFLSRVRASNLAILFI